MPKAGPSQRDELAARDFVENFSAVLADYGLPRMASRVLMFITVAEEDSLTAADLSERLGVSPAAISNALKYLMHIGLIKRISVPNSRRDRYAMTDQSWYTASVLKSGLFGMMAEQTAEGISAVGGEDTRAGARLTELRDFYAFLERELVAVMEKWRASRGA